jgi:hypothetical protein
MTAKIACFLKDFNVGMSRQHIAIAQKPTCKGMPGRSAAPSSFMRGCFCQPLAGVCSVTPRCQGHKKQAVHFSWLIRLRPHAKKKASRRKPLNKVQNNYLTMSCK